MPDNQPSEKSVKIEPARGAWAWAQPVDLGVNDPRPFESSTVFWRQIAQAATVGMFAIALGVVFSLMHSLLVPLLTALVVAMTVGPLVSTAEKAGVPDWVSAIVI